MSRDYRVTNGHDWAKPPVATVRVTEELEEAMLAGVRFYLDPIIQLQPERKIVGFSLVPLPAEQTP